VRGHGVDGGLPHFFGAHAHVPFLTSDDRFDPPRLQRVVYKKVATNDTPDFPIDTAFDECVAFIGDALSSSPAARVFVHCAMGSVIMPIVLCCSLGLRMSRSATIVLAYIMHTYRWPLELALRYLRVRLPFLLPGYDTESCA